mgnify:CR=1 FL=1
MAGGNNNNRGDGSPALLCHYTPVMSRSIYTRALSTAQSALRSPVLSSISAPSSPLSSPPLPSIQISNRNQIYLHLDSHILITHAGHCSTQLYSEIDVLIFHCPSILLDPGSDLGVTRRPLRVLAPHLSLVKCIFWKPGVGSRALQHSGILAGREEVR